MAVGGGRRKHWCVLVSLPFIPSNSVQAMFVYGAGTILLPLSYEDVRGKEGE